MVIRSLASKQCLVYRTFGIDGSLISGSLFVSGEQTIRHIAPDITEPFSHIMVAQLLFRIVELGDMCLIVTECSSHSIRERLASHVEGVPPSERNLISLRAEVCGILLRRSLAIYGRDCLALGKHILGVSDIEVSREIQPTLKEAEIDTEVLGYDRLPCKAAGYWSRCRCHTCLILSVERI